MSTDKVNEKLSRKLNLIEEEVSKLEDKLNIRNRFMTEQIMEKEDRLRILEQRIAIMEEKVSSLDNKLAIEIRALREVLMTIIANIGEDVKKLDKWKNKLLWLIITTCISSIATLLVFIFYKLL